MQAIRYSRFVHLEIISLLVFTPFCLPQNKESTKLVEAYLDFCEEDKFRRITPNECNKDIYFEKIYEAPTCVCLSGIWKLYDSYCNSAVVKLASGTCFQNRADRFHSFTYIGSFNPDTIAKELFVVLDIPKFYTLSLRQIIRKLDKPTQIPNLSTVLVLNGNLYQRRKSYCVQRSSSKLGIISKYVYVQGDIVARTRCFGQAVRAVGHNYITKITNHSDCSLFCENPIEKQARLNKNASNFRRNVKSSDLPLQITAALERKAAESTRQRLIESRQKVLLNRKMLQMSIENSFVPKNMEDFMEMKPNEGFLLLEKLKQITFKACGGLVSMEFLEKGIESLLAATIGGFTLETFRETDVEIIGVLLERCYNGSKSLRLLTDECSGEIMKVRNTSGVYEQINLPTNYNNSKYHVVLDVVWNMVDLINTFCVRAFKSSYRMYHELEQGMEKLFTTQLRRFWAEPDIPEDFYEHLFGPEWKMMARNLEKCVQGAYIQQPRMTRLRRPGLPVADRTFKWTFVNGTVKHRQPPPDPDGIITTSSRTTDHEFQEIESGTGTNFTARVRPISQAGSLRASISRPRPNVFPFSERNYLLSAVLDISCGHSKCNF